MILFIFGVLLVTTQAQPASLETKFLKPGLTCFTEKDNSESANSFLLQKESESILVDAGWSDNATIPVSFVKAVEHAQKVSTHLHFDHIRQWYKMEKIFLTKQQLESCVEKSCSPSMWQTVMKVKPFKFSGTIFEQSTENQLGARLQLISCSGHSKTDACFLDRDTRTLFVGDLFYLGPVFYFLPGGKIELAIGSLESILNRDDWDHLALSHGQCITDREKLVNFLEDLKGVYSRKRSWVLNFDFWFPLRAYKISSGYIVTNLFW